MPGPYVQMATFCERVLMEQDGVASVIRVIDRLIANAPVGAPAEIPEGVVLSATLAIFFKADDAHGRFPVTLRPQQPSGVYLPDQTYDVTFEGDERGVNLVINLGIPAMEGLYWFDVMVSERLLTRVPLRIMYQRVSPTR